MPIEQIAGKTSELSTLISIFEIADTHHISSSIGITHISHFGLADQTSCTNAAEHISRRITLRERRKPGVISNEPAHIGMSVDRPGRAQACHHNQISGLARIPARMYFRNSHKASHIIMTCDIDIISCDLRNLCSQADHANQGPHIILPHDREIRENNIFKKSRSPGNVTEQTHNVLAGAIDRKAGDRIILAVKCSGEWIIRGIPNSSG